MYEIASSTLIVIAAVSAMFGAAVGYCLGRMHEASLTGPLDPDECEAALERRAPARAATGQQGARTKQTLRAFATLPMWNGRSHRVLPRGPALVIDDSKPLRPLVIERARRLLKRSINWWMV